jgi:threonine/homoserine/homoserine lactone efflux protein
MASMDLILPRSAPLSDEVRTTFNSESTNLLSMATSTLVAFWAVTVLLIVVPGPDWAFTLGSTLSGQPVRAPVAGLVVGYGLLTAVVCAGVGAPAARTPAALTALTLIGGSYLMWQGIATLRRPTLPAAAADTPATGRRTVLKGIGISGLNPKALLLFLALLPQFTTPDAWPIAAQIAVLGSIFTLTCAIFYALLGTFAKTILHARPTAARAISRLSGIGMLSIGLVLIVEHIAK